MNHRLLSDPTEASGVAHVTIDTAAVIMGTLYQTETAQSASLYAPVI